ncbi:MAG: hypothetical protein H0W58_13510 [Acidobacteria bacterium]|nr:hypothetical protein [Acidobacteriota bacterium]
MTLFSWFAASNHNQINLTAEMTRAKPLRATPSLTMDVLMKQAVSPRVH